jgi:hypothetical protein
VLDLGWKSVQSQIGSGSSFGFTQSKVHYYWKEFKVQKQVRFTWARLLHGPKGLVNVRDWMSKRLIIYTGANQGQE